MPEVRDHDASANNQTDIQCIMNFGVAPPDVHALDQVIIDTVIAAQDQGRNEAKQFLGTPVERAIAVASAVEAEKTIDPEMANLEDPVIHQRAGLLEIIEPLAGSFDHGIAHGGYPSPRGNSFVAKCSRIADQRRNQQPMTVNRPHQRPHILIVSDDQGLAQFLSEGLVIAGFWTSVIASALQTIEVFRLRTFDAVIVDAALEGLGAEQLLLRLLGDGGRSGSITNRPVVVIAGSPQEMDEGTVARLGALKVYYPPLDIEPLALDLFAIVAAWRETHPNELWADEAAQAHE